MKLSNFLLKQTKVGDFVMIEDSGYYIGCTIIDYENLFIGSLNSGLLLREVKRSHYEKSDWTIKPVLIVEV